MRFNYLFEDKTLPKLRVRFSKDLIERIDSIKLNNQHNKERLSEFKNYIKGLRSYISNPVIAWDNTGKYYHKKNGQTHIKELGYDVWFVIKTTKKTKKNYVYVYKIVFNLVEFGLESDSMMEESDNSLLQTKVYKVYANAHQMSDEEHCQILLEKYEKSLHDLFR